MAYIVSATTDFQETTTFSIPLPTGWQENDYILVSMTQRGTSSIVISGYTLLNSTYYTTGENNVCFFYKKLTASESDLSVSSALANHNLYTVHLIRGANGTTFLDDFQYTETTGADTAFATLPSATSVVSNALVIRYLISRTLLPDGISIDSSSNLVRDTFNNTTRCCVTAWQDFKAAIGAVESVSLVAAQSDTHFTGTFVIKDDGTTNNYNISMVNDSDNIAMTGQTPWTTVENLLDLGATIGGVTTSSATVTYNPSVSAGASGFYNSRFDISGITTNEYFLGILLDYDTTVFNFTDRIFYGVVVNQSGSFNSGRNFYMFFQDTSNNWSGYKIFSADSYANNVPVPVFIDLGKTPDLSSGTLDITDVNRIGVGYQKVGVTTTTRNIYIRSFMLLDKFTIQGGFPGNPVTFFTISNIINAQGRLGLVSTQGSAQSVVKAKTQIGNGTTKTYFNASLSAIETPATGNLEYIVGANMTELSIYASPDDSIDFSNSLIISELEQDFTLNASTSSSATYDFNGCSLVGFNVTWVTNVDCAGMVFRQCNIIDGKAATFNEIVVRNSSSTTSAMIIDDTGSITNSAFTKGDETYAILIDAAGDIDLSGTTFSGYSDEINVTAATGVVNITRADGDATITAVTAGATVNFITPAISYNLLFPNIIDGSRYQIYNVTQATELTNALVSGGSGIDVTYALGTDYDAADEGRYRITYQSGTTCKEAIEGTFTFPAATSVNSLPTTQVDDAIYGTVAVDGSTITEFTWDSGNIQVDISDTDNTTTIQRIGSWFCYFATTATGIDEAFGAITWESVNSIKVNTSNVDLTLDNTKVAALLLTGGRLYRDDNTTIIAATSNSIQIDYSPVYTVETGVSGLTVSESSKLLSLNTAAETADAVWNEALADHLTAGTTGEALDNAGGGAATPPTEAEIYTYFTSLSRQDTFKADVSGLSTFNPATDVVANVTLVDTVTTNTDMRGTDSANTTAPDNASITAILADTNELQLNQGNWLTATGFATPTNVSDTQTAITNAISALNNLSAAQVNTEVDTALADYDGPTKAELDTAQAAIEAAISGLNDVTAVAVAGAVWDYLQSETTVTDSMKDAVEIVLVRSGLIPAAL